MEKSTYTFLLTLILSMIIIQASSQKMDACQLYDSYISGSMDKWVKESEVLINQIDVNTSEYDLFKIAMLKYGISGYYLGLDNDEEAALHLRSAFDVIDLLLKKEKKAEYLAMKGALQGMQIGLTPYKAMFLGPKSMGNIDEALEKDNSQPMVWIEKGNAMFHAPELLGGSREEGILNYKRGIALFEALQQTKCNWYYLHSIAILGTMYQKTGDYESAKAMFEKAMDIAPAFKWVKDELLPGLEKAQKK